MKKKVIFLTPSFLPLLGGVEKHVAAVSEVLYKRGWQIEVVTLQKEQTQPLQEKLSYCEVTRIPLEDQKSKKLLWRWVKNFFISVSSDTIIHIHDVGWWVLIQLMSYKKNKFYITFHGWEGKYPVRWQAKLHRLIISWLVKGSIHAGSFIQKYYWDKPNYVTYGGVTLPVSAKIVPLALPLQITFLGRLEAENQIHLYVEVLAKLAEVGIKAEITWVGDGKYRSVCEKWGKVTGMVKDVTKYTAKANIIFANSYLSILESQAQGKIICSLYDNPLKKDYLEMYPASNLLLLSSNSSDMVVKIRELLQKPEKYLHLSKQAAAFAQTQTWNKVADVYLQLWRET